MKKYFLVVLISAMYGHSFGQQFAINFMPRYSFGATIPPRYRLITGERFLTTDLKTKYAGTLVGTNGGETPYNKNSNGWGLDFCFKFTNETNGNAWGILLGGYRHKHLQHINFPNFAFKGHNLVGSYLFYRTTGVSGGLRRVLMNNRLLGWYVQVSALYSLQLQDFSGADNKWNKKDLGTARYVENGTGNVTTESALQPKTLAIAPELGIVNRGNFGLEMSISYQVPIGSPLYMNRESYYRQNQLVGTQEANITQQSIWFNLRLPINLFKRTKAARAPKPVRQPKQYEPKPAKTPKPARPPKQPKTTAPAPRKFQDLCMTVLDKTTKRAVPNAKVVFEGKIYNSNSEGKVLLIALPAGKKGKFTVQAANYEGSEVNFEAVVQEGCQPLNVELIPVPPTAPPAAVEINGQTVSKGESIILNAIQFEQGKSDLLPEGKAELDKVAEWMRKYPSLIIELSGHTSNEGDYDENVRLSKERVAVCKRYIAGQIIGSQERIKTVGYGPSRPRVPNTTPENRQKNRRVELKIESL